MVPHTVLKYLFRIRTRSGVVVENLSIYGRDEVEARRKLCQMYNDCEILEARGQPMALGARNAACSYEDVVDMIVAG
ncbi:hypothetical protein [Quatrionicoccus australiensis]|uniref:hypothetical protein n=1 Tax=Quatrionicoccus australiensis TaxID=138118 RepID=UPI001CF85D97|nr:hypothetical protein [Quatrionicoccus australiensis]UCV16325.1 hypothetical protein KI612_06400 [Quatrionicoccus australiensis]